MIFNFYKKYRRHCYHVHLCLWDV